jgi:glutamine synthetase type III
MDALRTVCDDLERLMPKDDWPVPSYQALLYTL